ncbi:MAG: single-stranded DNA-binding protein [Candidatus Omnitrophica bacterium]|nr:single-stranded DNA-binding protein [Candidatus Omnitrophota bacterium]
MASLNKVFLIGNLTRDPELRYIPSGMAVATFTIAVNRVYKSQSGEKKEQTTFVRVVVWGRRAEVASEYLSKGSPLFVEGRLQSRNWESQDGQKRSTIEVIADNIQFLRAGGKAPAPADTQAAPQEDLETINLDDAAGPVQENRQDDKKEKSDLNNEVPF